MHILQIIYLDMSHDSLLDLSLIFLFIFFFSLGCRMPFAHPGFSKTLLRVPTNPYYPLENFGGKLPGYYY